MKVNDWDALLRDGIAYTEDGHTATLIEFEGRERDSWGEAYEGDSVCHLYFKVGERFYRKAGYESSYRAGDVDWYDYDPAVEVFPKPVTKTIWSTMED